MRCGRSLPAERNGEVEQHKGEWSPLSYEHVGYKRGSDGRIAGLSHTHQRSYQYEQPEQL